VNPSHQPTVELTRIPMPITGSMLYDLVACPHRVTMDLFANPAERDAVSPFVQLLWKRGAAYEREIIAKIGGQFVDLSKYSPADSAQRTLEAMDRGESLIYRGRIAIDDLLGEPDLLRKEGTGYVAGDIKSGAGEEGSSDDTEGKPKKTYAVQLALYTDILERLGRSTGRRAFVWDVHGEEVSYDFMAVYGRGNSQSRVWDYYQECLHQARAIANGAAKTLPAYSTSTCKNCVWYTSCIEHLEKTNDLTLIPELGRSRRDAMIDQIPSIRGLAEVNVSDFLEGPKTVFAGISALTFEKLHERAKLLSAEDPKPYLRTAIKLPVTNTELFFDIEVDPMRDFCYLHGFVERRSGNNESERFVAFFADAINPGAEERAFTDAVHYMQESQPCAIYYYSKYERTIYRKLRAKYPHVCSEAELEALFDPTRSVDLYFDVVLKATEWPTRDYSIKTIAQYLGFSWKDAHPSGAASIEWFNRWAETGSPEVRQRILEYNEDDCRATRVLLDAIRVLPKGGAEQSWVGSSHFQAKLLRRKTSPEEYRVYRAGLEWNLADPIAIEKREDIKSETRWRDRLEPYHHQVTNLITFCRRLPVTLLADDVGLGKTVSAGLVISELISRSRVNKILVVCPKLLGPQWQEELKEKFNIDSEIVIGRELINADPKETGAIITTYQSARMYLDSIPQDRFQMLVLDEAHKLRNLYGVDSPPQVAVRFRKALEERRFRFVLMLTATPIHNRLWDLYSLVDLLTVARGHKNPFGSEGMFARKFIADSRDQARRLKPEAREEFRSIVYGYMSRVRRGDAKLYFPNRVVQMHKVNPTPEEQQLVEAIAEPIQAMNRLTQISILQALVSSPDALMAQLNNMARKGTAPADLAATVRAIVTRMPTSAKLRGLGALVNKLKLDNPEQWRLVVFTTRLETQTTIQAFLEKQGLRVGIINGDSGPRNQETLARFRKKPPDFHVIVSTEAGSEGINLQVANVLVNYDLPWNPMIVEQRIGRVQRLASEHASVAIFNITLRGTFEEYIVGRLMEKLQMASHAIGDIDALLEASGISGDDERGGVSFDEQIRQLVVASLAGKDVRVAMLQAEKSIDAAKNELEREEKTINAMLGGMDGVEYVGPRAPSLPATIRSMEVRDFTLAAFRILGARVTQQASDLYLAEENGGREQIRFCESANTELRSTLYAPGTPAFLRLVDRVIATGIHEADDEDENPEKESLAMADGWVLSFGGTPKDTKIEEVSRCFEGAALMRVRATVAHDSYERLVEVRCHPDKHTVLITGRRGLGHLSHTIQNPSDIGVSVERLVEAAKLDEAISEFSRFYLERRAQEMQAAGDDERKRKRLEDEFTPRLEMTLVALDGTVHRRIKETTSYILDGEPYDSTLTVTPHSREIIDAPELRTCSRSAKEVPKTCLNTCQITGALVLKHLLAKSELSERLALPEFTVLCSLSGKRILQDEAERSAVTGNLVTRLLLKSSALSGKRAEASNLGLCEFTGTEVLNSELATSDISGKRYRYDEERKSSISGLTGHRTEFVVCHETGQFLAAKEAEQCEVTGNYVRPGVLEECAITHKRVLPSQLSRCAATGQRVLNKLLLESSLTGARILEDIAVRSAAGKHCAPIEAKLCAWSGKRFHPDDLRVCKLTGLSVHFEFATADDNPRLQALVDVLNGVKRTADQPGLWERIVQIVTAMLGGGRCRVEAAVLSPARERLAVCAEVRTLLGFRIRHAGLIYEIGNDSVDGRLVQGRRSSTGWEQLKR
jgi:predicted RecB family nuclease